MSACPLLLIPGLLCTEAMWTPVMEALPATLDVRPVPALRRPSMSEMGAEVAAMMDGPTILVGHSMGGYAALEATRQATDWVAALILINTSAQPDTPVQSQRRKAGIAAVGQGRFIGVTANLFPELVAPDHQENAAILALVQQMADVVGEEGFLAQQKAILSRVDSRPLVQSLSCPVTVIGGREDRLTPPELSQDIYNDARDGELHILADCGHLAPLETPAIVAEVIRRAAGRAT